MIYPFGGGKTPGEQPPRQDGSRQSPGVENREKPGPEDFTAGAVRKAVFSQCAQHAATIFPLATSIVAAFWTAMVSASPASVMTALGAAFIGGSAFIWNYFVNGENRAVSHIEHLRDLRRQHNKLEVSDLIRESEEAGFEAGITQGQALVAAYDNLIGYIENRDDNKRDLTVARFRVLAEDTLAQGAVELEQALAIFKAAQSIDVEELRERIAELEAQKRGKGVSETTAKSLEQQILAHQKRIDRKAGSQDKLAELLAQVTEIETALQTTYLELVELGSRNPLQFLSQEGGASERLTTAVQAARKAEDKLLGRDAADNEKRAKYRQVAQDNS